MQAAWVWIGASIGLSTVLALGTLPVQAADDTICAGFNGLSDKPSLTLATVTGPDRVHFIEASGTKNASCPDLSPACQAKAFLVAGDSVVVSRTRGPLSCVDYVGAKGVSRTGWVPIARLTAVPVIRVTPADWRGTWKAIESTITIKDVPGSLLSIDGDATYGALDPDRVKRGAVNIGSIAGKVTPDGDALAFTMGDTRTLPITAGAETDCKVWMRRLGPYLLVDDNNNCGGMNVTFRGIYSRKS